jgi:hypothetical protein
MIKLPNITLVSVSSVKIEETIFALTSSMTGIEFGDVILISDECPENLPNGIRFEKCDKLKNIDEYSKFILYDLAKYIKTDYAMLVQYDGYVLRPHKWIDEFLNYDYIGAPWPKNVHFNGDLNIRVGNGGFTLRSKKLMNCLNELNLPFTDNGTGFYNEDGVLCNYYRRELENYGVKFATPEIAAMFSHETNCDEDVAEPFGFHKYKK